MEAKIEISMGGAAFEEQRGKTMSALDEYSRCRKCYLRNDDGSCRFYGRKRGKAATCGAYMDTLRKARKRG